jgi:uncharacterized protein
MIESISEYSLIQGWLPYALAAIGAICIGLSKSGFAGTATLNVVLMAEVFGAKNSVGLILPLLIFADLFGYWIHRRHGKWSDVLPLLIPTMLGVVVGWWWMDRWSDQGMKKVIGLIILGLLGFKLLMDRHPVWQKEVSNHALYRNGLGGLAGVTTMLANAAGPIMTIYFLSQKLDRHHHVSVFARFFLLINLFKVPFSANLGIINLKSLYTNLLLLPMVAVGLTLGAWLLKRISQSRFEFVLTLLTCLAAFYLVFN